MLIETPGFFGQCERTRSLNFLVDTGVTECGLQPDKVAGICINVLSAQEQGVNFAASYNGETLSDSDFKNFVVGEQIKYSLNTNLQVNITDNKNFQTTRFDTTTCGCDNILLEAHYTVYYEEFSPDETTSFNITNVTVDIVYGSYTPKSCNETLKLSRKTSWSFKRSLYSRKTSGGPGYIKGSKIITGNLQGVEKD